ncbi:MAG TPA: hypothetical protein V6D14_31375 [Coleofasciculaceae cyanobacterium]|jgi:hypothetical protein
MRISKFRLGTTITGLAILASTAAVPVSSATSGDGCGKKITSGSPDAKVALTSCVSTTPNKVVVTDAYVDFSSADPSQWTRCTVYIQLIDDSIEHSLVDQISCLDDAQQNKKKALYLASYGFKGVVGHTYHGEAYWEGTYAGQDLKSPKVSRSLDHYN